MGKTPVNHRNQTLWKGERVPNTSPRTSRAITPSSGACHLGLLQHSKAAESFANSVKIQEALTNGDVVSNSSIITSKIHLGNAYTAAGDLTKAVDTLSSCAARAEEVLGGNHILSGGFSQQHEYFPIF